MNTVSDLQKIGSLIRSAGGVPNSRYRKAMAAAKQLDRMLDEIQGRPPIKFVDYRLVLTNGKEKVISVPEGDDVLVAAKGFDIYSFSKI
jgi:hypothetical protein